MAAAPSVAIKYQRRGHGRTNAGTVRRSVLPRRSGASERAKPTPTNQKFPVRKTKAPPRLSAEITRGRKEGRWDVGGREGRGDGVGDGSGHARPRWMTAKIAQGLAMFASARNTPPGRSPYKMNMNRVRKWSKMCFGRYFPFALSVPSSPPPSPVCLVARVTFVFAACNLLHFDAAFVGIAIVGRGRAALGPRGRRVRRRC